VNEPGPRSAENARVAACHLEIELRKIVGPVAADHDLPAVLERDRVLGRRPERRRLEAGQPHRQRLAPGAAHFDELGPGGHAHPRVCGVVEIEPRALGSVDEDEQDAAVAVLPAPRVFVQAVERTAEVLRLHGTRSAASSPGGTFIGHTELRRRQALLGRRQREG
jgi:hypothetical protein